MKRFADLFSLFVILLYFALGTYVLMSSRFSGMQKEFRIIFAIFLFLYGAFRMARLWTKRRERNEE